MVLRLLRVGAIGLGLGLSLLGCAELPTLDAGICGNGFVEPEVGEACDVANADICFPPSDPNACHLRCAGDATLCEKNDPGKRAGWVCGLDEVCRYPAGQLSASATVAKDATELLLSDMDGDGRKDIIAVGQSGTEVIFVGADGQVAATQRLSGTPSRPAVGVLAKGATTRTLAYANETLGYRFFQTRADRRIEPTIVPSFYLPPEITSLRLIPTELDGDKGTDFLFAMTVTGPAPASVSISAIYGGAQTDAAIYTIPNVSPDDQTDEKNPLARKLLKDLPTADLDPLTPCPELVVAYQGDSDVYVAPLCDANGLLEGKNLKTDATVLPLPPLLALDGKAFVVDANVDGMLDVLVGVKCKNIGGPPGGCAGMMYAKGNGNGTFSLPFEDYWMTAEDSLTPLAAADLNGDGGVEVITRLGIHLTTPIPGGGIAQGNLWPAPFTRSWTEAVIDDFNGDGRMDVAGIEEGSAGIDVLLNAGNSLFNPFTYSTDGNLAHLGAGDFNGDLFADITCTMTTASNADRRKLLFAAGAPAGGLSAPVQIGELGSPVQLQKADVPLPLRQDTAADMMLVTRNLADKGKPHVVATAFGDGTSGLASSLLITHPELDASGEFAMSLSSAIGAFGPSGEPTFAGLLGRVGFSGGAGDLTITPEIWHMPANAQGLVQPPAAIRTPLDMLRGDAARPQLLTIDLEAGSADASALRDELLVAGYKHSAANPDEATPTLLLVRATAANSFVVEKTIDIALDGYVFIGSLASGDLDGNGYPDIVAAYCKTDGTDCNLAICLNKEESVSSHSLALPHTLPITNGIPIAITLHQMDGDKQAELLLLSLEPSAEQAGEYIPAWYRFDWKDEWVGDAQPMKDLVPATLAASGDVDGDRIDDLIAAGPGLITIYRGKDKVP